MTQKKRRKQKEIENHQSKIKSEREENRTRKNNHRLTIEINHIL